MNHRMKKHPLHLFRGTLRTKMLTLFLCLIAIPLSLQGMITYSKFTTSTEERTSAYTAQIVHQINQNLDRNMEEMKRLSLMPLYDNSILSILRELGGSAQAPLYLSTEKRQKMTLYISSLSYSRPEVKGIQIVSLNGLVFSNLDPSTMKAQVDLRKEEWYSRVLAGNGASVIIPSHRPAYYVDSSMDRYFSVARLLREPNTNLPLGIIKIDMKMEMIDQILTNMPFTKEGSLIIVNQQQELFYEKRENETTPGYQALLQETAGLVHPGQSGRTISLQGQRYLLIDNVSARTGLTVISMIPIDSLLKDSNDLRSFTILIAAIFLVVAGGLASYFAYSLSKPLVSLKEKMLQVEQGHFHERVPVSSADEIGKLSEQFNHMVEEINRLVNEVYVISLREREAELAALQSQIHPHFIYNTLEAINMMAIRAGNYDVSDMVSSLGKLMRYTVERGDGFVTLAQELESLSSYVRIQQTRLGDRIQVVMEVDESLRDAPIPKLLLQPLLENAIYHGIERQERGGTIWLSVARDAEAMQISVRDNGKGMTQPELIRLRSSVRIPFHQNEAASSQRTGTALRNIYQRITLLYGAGYHLMMDSQAGQGSIFSLRIPIENEKRAMRHVQSLASGG
ncbi:cache domain-containing sensor histidine kinase [Brevibacillus centrosporus]|uniref:Two-component system, sensor histidine kinase YesM n=1 Tax=Brevibacillus centrosporus TaxID=54910 RepID=A0A1I3M6T1_9BACL|nr:sensor histidine kinase [Brevibacillus centrosporus]SFI92744.1 two-component system, sensor histidine kinase YesM [Brevibacillus centrosporus]